MLQKLLKACSLRRVLYMRLPRTAGLVMSISVFLLLAAFFILTPMPTQAATTNTLNFQARLQTNGGAIVPDGTYNVEFKLYSVLAAGSPLWTETRLNSNSQGVTVRNGYLTANLGSVTAFPTSINWDQELYIGLTVRGVGSCAFTGCTPTDSEMSPRLKMTGVPYAFRAGSLATGNGTLQSTLSIIQPTVGNQIFQIQDQGAAGTYSLLTNTSGVQLQATTPGTQQTGNLNISGTGIAGTSIQTPLLDTAAAVALNIGTTNATVINLNENTTLAAGKTLSLANTTNANLVTLLSGVTAASYSLTLPAAAPALSQCLQNDGTTIGQLTFGSCGGSSGVTTVGTYSTVATAANAATITGSAISFQSASATAPGMVDTGTQTFAGAKTFNGAITAGSTINTNTFTGSALTFGTAGTATIQSAASQALNITGNAASTFAINAGALTLQSSGAEAQIQLFGGSASINLNTGAAGTVVIGSSDTSTVNVGATTNNIRTINVGIGTGGSQAQTVNIGSQGGASVTNISGGTGGINLTGAVAIAGTITLNSTQFTNNGSTLNTAQAITDRATGGPIGTAAATVDADTSFTVAQTTAAQTLSLPNPTSATAGRVVYVANIGSASFIMHGVTLAAASAQQYIWNGSAWTAASVSGSGSGVTTIGTIDSQTKSTNGAVITGNTLVLQNADASFAGLVSTGIQTFAGAKTFTGDVIVSTTLANDFAIEGINNSVTGLGIYGYANSNSATADLLRLDGNSGTVLSVKTNGAVLSRNSTDTPTAFQIQNTAGTSVLNVDTTTNKLSLRALADVATLGTELMTAANSFPATTGWTAISGTGQAATATHTSGGGTTALSPSPALAIVAGVRYKLSFTVSGRTTGTLVPSIGGVSDNAISLSGTFDTLITASTTANLAFTPSNTFNGTVTAVSVIAITSYGSTLQLNDSAGATAFQVRTSASASFNSYVGTSTGLYNGTGIRNTALGGSTMQNNYSGSQNTGIGFQALFKNVAGSDNTAVGFGAINNFYSGSGNTGVGREALSGIINGSNNSAFGYLAGDSDAAGFFTTSNVSNATLIGARAQSQIDNSLILGGAGIHGATNSSAVKVGIGSIRPDNILSVTPTQYDTGTVSQSGTTVTGVGTTFTSAMVGSRMSFPGGSMQTITAFNSVTSLTVSLSQTVASTAYRIHYNGLQVTTAGTVGIGTIAPSAQLDVEGTAMFGGTNSITAFQIQDSASATLFNVDTSGNIIKIGNSTGTNTATTILVLDSATADPTTLTGKDGGLYYNSTTTSLKAIENGAVGTLGSWKYLGNITMGAAAANTGTLTVPAKKHLLIRYRIAGYSGGGGIARWQFGAPTIDTANNYSFKTSDDFGAPTSVSTTSGIAVATASTTTERWGVVEIFNRSGSNKLISLHGSSQSTPTPAGVETANEVRGMWVNTNQITSITLIGNGVNLTANTEFSVWGADDN